MVISSEKKGVGYPVSSVFADVLGCRSKLKNHKNKVSVLNSALGYFWKHAGNIFWKHAGWNVPRVVAHFSSMQMCSWTLLGAGIFRNMYARRTNFGNQTHSIKKHCCGQNVDAVRYQQTRAQPIFQSNAQVYDFARVSLAGAGTWLQLMGHGPVQVLNSPSRASALCCFHVNNSQVHAKRQTQTLFGLVYS